MDGPVGHTQSARSRRPSLPRGDNTSNVLRAYMKKKGRSQNLNILSFRLHPITAARFDSRARIMPDPFPFVARFDYWTHTRTFLKSRECRAQDSERTPFRASTPQRRPALRVLRERTTGLRGRNVPAFCLRRPGTLQTQKHPGKLFTPFSLFRSAEVGRRRRLEYISEPRRLILSN